MMAIQWNNATSGFMSNQTSSYFSTAVEVHVSELMMLTRVFFYLVTPNETSFKTIEECPNYFTRFLPYLPLIVIPEIFVLYLQGKRLPRFGDSICSLCCAILIFLPVSVVGHIEINLYSWCYDKFHIIDLPWDSPLTWFLCVFGTDLGLYVWHRVAHEVNLIWIFHQVHHTSQDFNITVGIRLPTFNRYIAILFYLPCALFFPPSIFYVHYQINYIYGLWTHSNAFPSFGYLDYFLNGPSLHRVHHGRNRYCIDKNYGSVFSIWDVLFGTFVLEKPGEEIYYGLVHSVNSLDPVYIQVHPVRMMYRRFMEEKGIGNKLSVIFKGPGWCPGLPRLGDINDVPVEPEEKTLYDTHLPLWLKLYILLHTFIAFLLFSLIKDIKLMVGMSLTCLHCGYVFWTIACIGCFVEVRRYAPLLEGLRCAMYFVLEIALQSGLTSNVYLMYGLRVIFGASTLIWVANLRVFAPDLGKRQKIE